LAELTTDFARARPALRLSIAALCALLALVVVLGELHVSGSTLPQQLRPLSAAGRVGLILWSLLWFAGLALILLALSARWIFALAATLVAALAILVLSVTKLAYLNSKLMFIDLYFSLRDWAEIEFLVGHYTEIVIGTLVFLACSALALVVLWRSDLPLPGIRLKAAICALIVVVAIGGIDRTIMPYNLKANAFWRVARDERFFSDLFLSAQFFSDMLRMPIALPHTAKVDPALAADLDRMQAAQPVAGKPPHIILVLHESSADPAIYFDGPRYQVQPGFFTSGDNVRRRLVVNTFGGNTWMSEHGLLLGVDLNYLPGIGPFLGMVAVGKFANTLADELRADGYRVVANYPSALSFQNTGRFYRSIGFDDVVSLAPLGLQRDRDYFAYALDQLRQSIADDADRPTFQMLWTAATHYPYNTPAFPQVRSDEIVNGDPAAEFARRQRIAADDLAWFEQQLAASFPDQRFLVVGFGDHQPKITDGYYSGAAAPPMRPNDTAETRFLTYFRINGVNFQPDYAELSQKASIGYLGEMILAAARLPASRAVLARRWLRLRCDGMWFDCADQAAVLSANQVLSSGQSALVRADR